MRPILLALFLSGLAGAGALGALGLLYFYMRPEDEKKPPHSAVSAGAPESGEAAARARLPITVPPDQITPDTLFYRTLQPDQWVRYIGKIAADATGIGPWKNIWPAYSGPNRLERFGAEEAERLENATLPGKSTRPGDDVWAWNDMVVLAGGAGFAVIREGDLIAFIQVAIS